MKYVLITFTLMFLGMIVTVDAVSQPMCRYQVIDSKTELIEDGGSASLLIHPHDRWFLQNKEWRRFTQTLKTEKTENTIRIQGNNSEINITFIGLNPAGKPMPTNSLTGFKTWINDSLDYIKWGYDLKLPNKKFKAIVNISSNTSLELFNNDTLIDEMRISFKDVLLYNYTFSVNKTSETNVEYLINKNWSKHNVNDLITIDPTIEKYFQNDTQDTYVRSDVPNSNFGNDPFAIVQGSLTSTDIYRTYMKFDLSGLHITDIDSAVLYMYFYSSSGASGEINVTAHEVYNKTWVETQPTWNDQPANTTLDPNKYNTTILDSQKWDNKYKLDQDNNVTVSAFDLIQTGQDGQQIFQTQSSCSINKFTFHLSQGGNRLNISLLDGSTVLFYNDTPGNANAGWNTITISTPIQLTANHNYTIRLVNLSTSGTAGWSLNGTATTYPYGNYIDGGAQTTQDAIFQTYCTPYEWKTWNVTEAAIRNKGTNLTILLKVNDETGTDSGVAFRTKEVGWPNTDHRPYLNITYTPYLNVEIYSPTNTSYNTSSVWLNWSVNKVIEWAGYSLNGKNNFSFYPVAKLDKWDSSDYSAASYFGNGNPYYVYKLNDFTYDNYTKLNSSDNSYTSTEYSTGLNYLCEQYIINLTASKDKISNLTIYWEGNTSTTALYLRGESHIYNYTSSSWITWATWPDNGIEVNKSKTWNDSASIATLIDNRQVKFGVCAVASGAYISKTLKVYTDYVYTKINTSKYNLTITGVNGQNNVTLWSNDSTGTYNTSTIWFYLDSVAPTINSNQTYPSTPKFWNLVNISANVTDNIAVDSVNFTVISPTAIQFYNKNGTQSDDIWNSTTFRINETGSWYINITAKDYLTGNTNTSEWNFTITDVITYTPQSIIDTIQQGKYDDTYNITISHDSSENFNFTLTPYINSTVFNITFNESGWGPTCSVNISEGKSVKIQTNISVNSTATATTYYGNISINRTDTNTIENISLEITVSAVPTGDVDLVSPSAWTVNMYTDDSNSHDYNITNIGEGTLTACNFSLDGDFVGKNWYSFNDSNIDLGPGDYKIVKLTISHPTEGSYSTDQGIDVVCSTAGGTDTLKPEDRVPVDLVATVETVTEEGGGGGGTTTTPSINFSNTSMLFEIEKYGQCISTTLGMGWDGPDQTISITVTGEIENLTETPKTGDTIYLKRGEVFELPVKVCLPKKSELKQEMIKYEQYSWTGEIEFMIKLPTITKTESVPMTIKKIAFIVPPGEEKPISLPSTPIIIVGLVIATIVGIYLFIPAKPKSI